MIVGNPPRPYYLDMDTGSDLTWIQCDAPCSSCAKVSFFCNWCQLLGNSSLWFHTSANRHLCTANAQLTIWKNFHNSLLFVFCSVKWLVPSLFWGFSFQPTYCKESELVQKPSFVWVLSDYGLNNKSKVKKLIVPRLRWILNSDQSYHQTQPVMELIISWKKWILLMGII